MLKYVNKSYAQIRQNVIVEFEFEIFLSTIFTKVTNTRDIKQKKIEKERCEPITP